MENLRETLKSARSLAAAASPDAIEAFAAAAESARRSLPVLFDLLSSFLLERAREEGDYDPRLLLNRAMRVQPDWSNIEMAWENLDAVLHDVVGLLGRIGEALGDGEEGSPCYLRS